MAIAALVLGIVGLFLSWTVVLVILSILAVIFGVIGRNKARREPGLGGGGMAMAGIITGAIGILIALAIIVIGAVAVDEASDLNDDLQEQLDELEEQTQ